MGPQSTVRADFPAQPVLLPLRTNEDSKDLGLLAWPLGKLGSRVSGAGQSQICTSRKCGVGASGDAVG